MISIDVFVLPGCGRCLSGLAELKEIVQSFGPAAFRWEERNLLDNIEAAVQLGILSAPAIAVDGTLAFSSLPSPQQLRAALAIRIAVS